MIIHRKARINQILSLFCRQADLESQLRAKARAAESAEQTAKEAAAASEEDGSLWRLPLWPPRRGVAVPSNMALRRVIASRKLGRACGSSCQHA